MRFCFPLSKNGKRKKERRRRRKRKKKQNLFLRTLQKVVEGEVVRRDVLLALGVPRDLVLDPLADLMMSFWFYFEEKRGKKVSFFSFFYFLRSTFDLSLSASTSTFDQKKKARLTPLAPSTLASLTGAILVSTSSGSSRYTVSYRSW